MLEQLLINGLIAASLYLLVGIGFGLVYSTVGFFNFSHGMVFTAGAYLLFALHTFFSFPLLLSVAGAVVLSSCLGCIFEVCVFRPLRHKSSSVMCQMLASLGIYVMLQNTVALLLGDDVKTVRSGVVEEGINICGARITPVQISAICASVMLMVLVVVVLRTTKIGKAIRAVANDAELSSICGLNSDRVRLCAFALSSGLAGIAGILMALDVDITPTMGMNTLMMGIVVVFVGGVDSIPGIALGALLLGVAQNLGVWKIGSEWQYAIAFVILLAFLLFKPEGFMGKRIKKATV